MLRTLVLLLILANVTFLAWSHGWLRGAGLGPAQVTEPQRLQQQIHPEALSLLPMPGTSATAAGTLGGAAPKPASAASAAATSASRAAARASAPATAKPASSAATSPEHSASAAARTATTSCVQLGPYAKAGDDVSAVLRAAGITAVARRASPPPQWMVYIGPLPDEPAVRHRLAALQQLGLRDASFAPVIDRPRYMPGISLGVFSTKAAAHQQLAMVRAKGVNGAHLVQRNAGYQATYLVLKNLSPAQSRALHAIAPARLYDHKPEACTQD